MKVVHPVAPSSTAAIASPTNVAARIEIQYSGEAFAATANSSNYTGNVRISSLESVNNFAAANLEAVHFAAGARTTWHSHPVGQLLIVTTGMGWIQEDGKKPRVIEAGDVVWIPAGLRHWHGATDATAMSQVEVTYISVESESGRQHLAASTVSCMTS
jgi:quercetin dioxygenase-like cupin family protein